MNHPSGYIWAADTVPRIKSIFKLHARIRMRPRCPLPARTARASRPCRICAGSPGAVVSKADKARSKTERGAASDSSPGATQSNLQLHQRERGQSAQRQDQRRGGLVPTRLNSHPTTAKKTSGALSSRHPPCQLAPDWRWSADPDLEGSLAPPFARIARVATHPLWGAS